MNVASTTPEDGYLTQEERAQVKRFLSQPEEFPTDLGAWISQYVALNGKVSQYQIQGLSRLVPRSAAVATQEGKGWDANYGDLATVGPELTDLGAGTYLVMFSSEVLHTEAAVLSRMSLSINGATALDANGVSYITSSFANRYPIVRYQVLELPLPSNTLRCKYARTGDGVSLAYHQNRNLTAIRMGNL